ncbi:MAG: GNAT family N-acetyltransferase [Nitriliruptorales bacterium]
MPGSAEASVGVVEVASADTAADALAFLVAASEVVGAPVVDESEQVALGQARDKRPVKGWRGLVATTEGEIVGYAGVRGGGDEAVADLAVDRLRPGAAEASRVLLAALVDHAPVTVWMRDVDQGDVDVAAEAGFAVVRRLFVMGRGVADYAADPDPPGGIWLRSFRPGEDDDAVVGLLARAYEGTPDAAWEPARFAALQERDWFDAQDLVVASGRDDDVAGIHWTKRRDADTGEVYHLVVDPDCQGLGLGRALLRAGLVHLRRRGRTDVILWVDEANSEAVRLYASEGFVRRWEDVAFSRRPAA